jgi:hypothetical protein
LPGKLADAISMSNKSGENPLFVAVVEAEKSCSRLMPSASFFKSIDVVGESKDHRSEGDTSHTLTTASAVTVTRQEPLTPSGCHRADTTGDLDVTWVVGPKVNIFGFNGLGSSLVRCDESGSTHICTVCVVRMAR